MRLAAWLAVTAFSVTNLECSAQRRFRRQAYPPNPAPFQPRVEDYNLPPKFNNGLDVNPGTRVTVDGNLNVPILGWGIWDYKGELILQVSGVKVGRPNTRVGFGSLQRPTNVLGISADTLATLARDGNFNQARGLWTISLLAIWHPTAAVKSE
ncbi:unnamed protein product [Nippostrongylus brasiliensis]|uniref:SLBB domain-containing protein n=1 Tax=Nippostrongylus brasiliensis TaxID=27835 RepID=A0A0N4YT62_NIPBR|nr:unnamed protein product [Nippostrongylus brasiliensis]